MARIRLLATGVTDSTAIRTETFRGQEYTVVPVVMLVEGVIQGLNAVEPEFAPAAEFGKFPASWNGRPITMDHPRDSSNSLTSANSPDILELYAFGFLANTTLDNTKLKSEAWIDNAIVADKGGDFQATLDRLNSGDVYVEVSTGLFTDVITVSGWFGDTKYGFAWQGVVPDHLAFLPEGTIGACSVADGCGAPRLNVAGFAKHDGAATVVMGQPVNLGSPDNAPCCEACANGETCMADNANPDQPAPATSPPADPPASEPVPETIPAPAPTGPAAPAQPGLETGEAEATPESAAAELEANQQAATTLQILVANAIPPGMIFENVESILESALETFLGEGTNVWILALTTDRVAFKTYGCNYCYDGCGYDCCDDGPMAINYDMTADGGVTFTGQPVPVNLIISIVDDPNEAAQPTDPNAVAANEASSGANNQNQEDLMADDTRQVDDQPGGGGDVNANASGAAPDGATPRDLESYLSTVPSELADVLREGAELRTQKRNGLIEKIVANSNGLYTKQDLEGKDMAELVKLETLSRPKDDFSGRAFPNGASEGINSNNSQRDNQRTVPEAPKAFPTRVQSLEPESGQDNRAAA